MFVIVCNIIDHCCVAASIGEGAIFCIRMVSRLEKTRRRARDSMSIIIGVSCHLLSSIYIFCKGRGQGCFCCVDRLACRSRFARMLLAFFSRCARVMLAFCLRVCSRGMPHGVPFAVGPLSPSMIESAAVLPRHHLAFLCCGHIVHKIIAYKMHIIFQHP